MTHSHPVRVYYEDTDLAGIVYHANYLRFIERGRTEWVEALGIDQRHLRETTGIVFVVRRLAADYLAPARFGDRLAVQTDLAMIGGARIDLTQAVLLGERRLFTADVTLVCVGADGRAVRIPDAVRGRLAQARAAPQG